MHNQNPLTFSNTIINISKINIYEAVKMIETIKDDPVYHETIYQVSKSLYVSDKRLSIDLLNIIIHNRKYFNGHRAYTSCINNDEEELDSMVNYLKITYQVGLLDIESYMENLDEIVFSISEYYPSRVKELLKEIDSIATTQYKDYQVKG